MTSTARSLRYALAILTTSLVTPSVWAHAHLTHQYPAAKRASDSCTAGNHFKLLGRC